MPLANIAAGIAIYRGAKGLMSRLKPKPKKKPAKKIKKMKKRQVTGISNISERRQLQQLLDEEK